MNKRCREATGEELGFLRCEREEGHRGKHRATRPVAQFDGDTYGYEIEWPQVSRPESKEEGR